MLSRRPAQLLSALALAALAGCATDANPTADPAAASREIRRHIAGIRTAILARSAAGIIQPGTPDWTFTGPDGITLDRAGFVARTTELFGRIVAIESLDTRVEQITFREPAVAEVEISQTMVRTERTTPAGPVARLRLRYREQHTWIHTPEGWRVRRVQFLSPPERTMLTGG